MVRRLCVLAAATSLVSLPATAQQDLEPLLALVPDEAFAVAVAARPAALVRDLAAVAEPVPEGLPADLVAQLGIALTALRAALDGPTADWFERMAGGGAVAALRPPATAGEPRWLLVLRPTDLAAAQAFCDVRAGGVPRAMRDGLLVLGEGAAAAPGRWAHRELAGRAASSAGVVAEVLLPALRERLGARAPALDRLHGAARFVFAPIVHALAAGERLQVELAADDARVQLTARADASLAPAVPPHGDAPTAAGAPLAVLAALQLDRSLHRLLAEPARFLDEDGVQAVRGFLSIADALAGPRASFADDLLGGLREPLLLHVLPSAPAADDAARSPLVVPELAISAPVVDDDAVAVAFRVARALATIANAERMQRREAPFVLRQRTADDGHGLVAEPPPWRGPGAPPLDRQLSPALWYGNGRLAAATTLRAARAVCAAEVLPGAGVGDRVSLRGPAIAAAVERSRGVVELARMLDEGESRDEARRFVDAVVAVAAALATVDAVVVADGTATELRLTVERRR